MVPICAISCALVLIDGRMKEGNLFSVLAYSHLVRRRIHFFFSSAQLSEVFRCTSMSIDPRFSMDSRTESPNPNPNPNSISNLP